MQPSGPKFSLGEAAFDWPRADDCAPLPPNKERAPEGWRAALLAPEGSKSGLISGVFTACRAGRDWVVASAPALTLKLESRAAPDSEQPDPRKRELRNLSLARPLSARRDLPLALEVTCYRGADSADVAGTVRTLLRSPFTALRITDVPEDGTASNACNSVLAAAAAAGSNTLTTLTLGQCPVALPHPSRFPQLRNLDIKYPDEPACEVICSYLTQVTSLALRHEATRRLALPAVFARPTHTLTRLSITRITDELVRLLLQQVPVLRQLEGKAVYLSTDHSGATWGVREIDILPSQLGSEYIQVCRLPTSTAPDVRRQIKADNTFFMVGQGSTDLDRVARACPGWTIKAVRIMFCIRYWSRDAFSTALRQAEGLQVPGGRLQLLGGQWNAEAAQMLAAGLTALHELRCTVDWDRPLTVATLGLVLQMGPHMRELMVKSLDLQSNTHANTLWPWDTLHLRECNVTMLALLPNPVGSVRDVGCPQLFMDARVTQADVPALKARLQHMHFHGYLTVTLRCPDGPPDTHPATLHTMMTILQSIRVNLPSKPSNHRPASGKIYPCIELQGWSLTTDVLAALKGLPSWPGARVDFTKCTFPLEPNEYRQLGDVVPRSFAEWDIGDVSARLLMNVCAGIEKARAGWGLGRVLVSLGGIGRLVSNCAPPVPVGEHVMVRHPL